jgi:hypothetical protein
VLPIVAAGRHEIVKSNHVLSDQIRLIPTPGHTIDHFSVHVGKSGYDAVITGDVVHSPIQARHPELFHFVDYDRKQGIQSRRTLFERFVDTPTLLCTAIFLCPPSVASRVGERASSSSRCRTRTRSKATCWTGQAAHLALPAFDRAALLEAVDRPTQVRMALPDGDAISLAGSCTQGTMRRRLLCGKFTKPDRLQTALDLAKRINRP